MASYEWALGLKYNPTLLRLLCSGGVIPDAPIGINPWSLGSKMEATRIVAKSHGGLKCQLDTKK